MNVLQELETYEYRIEEVTDLGQQLISKSHPKSEEIEEIISGMFLDLRGEGGYPQLLQPAN